ncbi:MAG: glycerol-3-phosphate 1-O-acyltransferase PlsY [Chitinophagales bacterium]|nr:glycerol-3-phosphate 1-O-acyltransferase PlsY [Chitinophagales bacterium]MDW8427600.1 glycerol-3-phosphate 1-O-acyltransferase PlsY [Chitinophagales bacterium]
MFWTVTAGLVVAYLIGAIPTSVWLGRWFYGTDVRNAGSGNAGATNTFRVLGARAGVAVLLFDVAKGILAIWAGRLWVPEDERALWLDAALGLAAAYGHIFPIYLGFRGGKGVATLFGVVLYLFPKAAMISAAVFLVVLICTRIVSLSSLSGALVLPAAIWLTVAEPRTIPVLFGVLALFTVLYTHRQNIIRLRQGTEPRLIFARSTKKR